MNNPFDLIDTRLGNIENLLLDLKLGSLTNLVEPNTTNDFLTIQEAAKFLSLKVPTLYSKVSKGELSCMKRGKRLYFSQTELSDYLKQGRKKTLTEIASEADNYLVKKKKG